MHDKQVRRRRAVLGLLVAVSLILLTAYFGASPNSPLHTVQRGIVQVVSPVQAGASTVLSPVRDVANWVSDTLRAKNQRDQLRKEVNQLTAQVDQLKTEQLRNVQLARQVKLDQNIGLSNYHLVAANVIGRDPSLWYQQVTVDAGSDEGVTQNAPVVADGALVGDVTTVDPSVSVVTLLTDHAFAVAADVLNQRGDNGVLAPSVGNPNQLLLQDLPANAQVAVGQQVVTSGFKSGSLTSLYPAGIPIGTVSGVNPTQLFNNNEVQVSPAADLRHFASVQILTTPHPGNARAQVPGG
ncbi:MAG TPA: rod shape-determining protein MreC [Solirubrobacteraceae bacterium]|nr:rod shape-determining protein MreC [Solirubrobacteraceae bacterium]